MLDEAGLMEAKIFASGDLDEYIIESLRGQGARIDMWGVGTRLSTGQDGSLNGVYKLSAVRDGEGQWQYKLKLSEQVDKITSPGILQVRRFRGDHEFMADMIYDELLGVPSERVVVDPADPTRRKVIGTEVAHEDLLVKIFHQGRRVYDPPPLADTRKRAAAQLESLHPAIRRLVNPHEYPAGLEKNLHELKTRLILKMRGLEK